MPASDDGASSSSAPASPTLPPSRLGTKAHWDAVYEREVANFRENPDDEGEVWFGESASRRMIASLRSLLASGALTAPFSVLDLGTGNGLLLHTLLDAALTPPARMLGVDYSEGSVTLAREVAQARGEGAEEIEWRQCDCVDDAEAVEALGEWDVLLDKGTLDAIALSPSARDAVPSYIRSIRTLRGAHGILLLTSCNFTLDELRALFLDADVEGARDEIEELEEDKRPKFSFGGKTGNTTTAVMVRRRRQ